MSLADRLRTLEREFPEISGGDMLSRTARSIILPQLIRAATKDEAGLTAKLHDFVRRFVRALEIPPSAIYDEPRDS